MTKAGVDVLVVGAGPAGSATTRHLARQGYRVVAVDRATFPREKACSEYMSPEAVRLLDRLGVVPDAGGGRRCPALRDHSHRSGWKPTDRVVCPGRCFPVAARRVLDRQANSRRRNWLTRRGQRGERCWRESAWKHCSMKTAPWEEPCFAILPAGGGRFARASPSAPMVCAPSWRAGSGRRTHGRPSRMAFVAHVSGVSGMGDVAEMHVGPSGYVGLNHLGAGVTNVALVVPRSLAVQARGRPTAFFQEQLELFPECADGCRPMESFARSWSPVPSPPGPARS